MFSIYVYLCLIFHSVQECFPERLNLKEKKYFHNMFPWHIKHCFENSSLCSYVIFSCHLATKLLRKSFYVKKKEGGVAKIVPNCYVIVDLQMLVEASQTTPKGVVYNSNYFKYRKSSAYTRLKIHLKFHIPVS